MLTLEKFEEASEIVKKVTLETKLVYSDYRNIKITTPEDLNTAEMFIENIF